MERELIAQLLVNSLPPSIFRRLNTTRQFIEQLGLSRRTAITIGSIGTFDILTLFRSFRATLSDADECAVLDVEGNNLSVSSRGDGWQIRRQPEVPVQEVNHPVFLLLAADAVRRVMAFDNLRADLGPTATQFDAMGVALSYRPATDAELSAFFAELEEGVAGRRRRILAAIEKCHFSLTDLVPNSLAYFEKCYGPSPGSASPDEYFSVDLPEYRRDLLSRDLAGALILCLPAYLRDDLSLAGLIESRSNDDVWAALEVAAPLADPFSALAALEISICRSGQDERFMELSQRAVARLTADRFEGPGNADLYALLPRVALAVEDQLSGLEGAMTRQPFWRRLCAFAHAAWLVRHLPFPKAETEPFCEWLRGHHALPDSLREMLDLRAEPMWLTSNLTSQGLRAEVLGRLALLVERHRIEGREVPASQEISEAIEEFDKVARPLARHTPGPLDAHKRPAAQGSERLLREKASQDFSRELSSDLASQRWATAANMTDIIALPETVLTEITRLVTPGKPARHTGSIAERRVGLLSAGLIAARHRRPDLAEAVAAHCLAEATHASDAESVDVLLSALLVASASFEADDEWAAWIEPKLFSLAERLPSDGGPAHDWLGYAISALGRLLPPRRKICYRAEALINMLK